MHYGKNSDNRGDSKKALQCNPTTSRHESEAAAGASDERCGHMEDLVFRRSKVGKAPRPSSKKPMKEVWNRLGGLKERGFHGNAIFLLDVPGVAGQLAEKSG